VYSAGTFIPYDNDSSQQITNNIMSIWLEKYQTITPVKNPTILCGVSIANIFTGKSELFEYQAPYYLNPTTFDELERCVSTYCPSEVVINTTTLSPEIIHTIVQYVGLQNSVLHKHFAENESTVRCTQQKYIHQLLTTFFGAESLAICAEFQNNEIATQSFCYLLHFIQQHNPDLVRKIEMPTFSSNSQKMLLANHTLKQLNIIDDLSHSGKRAGQYSSVLSFLNKCSSPMGKRRFQQQLISPTYDREWLQREYDIN
jgi:DNA mismatch repair protein MutS